VPMILTSGGVRVRPAGKPKCKSRDGSSNLPTLYQKLNIY